MTLIRSETLWHDHVSGAEATVKCIETDRGVPWEKAKERFDAFTAEGRTCYWIISKHAPFGWATSAEGSPRMVALAVRRSGESSRRESIPAPSEFQFSEAQYHAHCRLRLCDAIKVAAEGPAPAHGSRCR